LFNIILNNFLLFQTHVSDTSIAPTFAGGGTPGILQFIRASLAYQLRNSIGLDRIHKKEQELKEYFVNQVKSIEGLVRYCKYSKNKLPIFSFNLEGKDPYSVVKLLSDRYNIDVRAGCSCAGPYGHDLLHLEEGEESY
jgi:selenocysteine lyase/cysteine desulfurase